MNKSKAISGVVAIVLLVLVGVFILQVFTDGTSQAEYNYSSIDNGTLEIGGSYSTSISNLDSATIMYYDDIELEFEYRVSGSNVGKYYKGKFNVVDNGKTISGVYVNVLTINTAIIKIECNDNDYSVYYINCDTLADTLALYNSMV